MKSFFSFVASALKFVLGLFLLMIVIACVYGCTHDMINSNGHTSSTQGTTPSIATAPSSPPWPASETTLDELVSKFSEQYRTAPNEMAEGALRHQRARSICSSLGSTRTVRGWIGTVAELSSNSDGRGVLAIRISDNLVVTTWNNALSDFEDHTLIDPEGSVGRAAAAMKVGDAVEFAGTFVSGADDCFSVANLTQSGAMTDTTFVMRFSAIRTAP